MTQIIAITGKVATGKTAIAKRLASELGWQRLGIDLERRRGGNWTTLVNSVHRLTAPAIIEGVLLPDGYLRALAQHDTIMLRVVCDERERQLRLRDRQPGPATRGGSPRWPNMRTVSTTYGVSQQLLAGIAAESTTHGG